MNVLFVHYEEDPISPEKPVESHERMQFGISYISSFLREHGHRTGLVVPTRRSMDIVDEYVRDFDPGLVCFTSVYSVYHSVAEVASRVKRRRPDLFLAIGGPHPTLRPDDCLRDSFDAVCVGEGEYPTLELVEQLESGRHPGRIPNLYIKRGNVIERNEPRPFMEDIDRLPYPDREMWLPWLARPLSRPSVLAGRGCPFRCTYCSNHALRKAADGKYVRLRSPRGIAGELKELKRILPLLEEVYLEVETLGATRGWALDLCSHLEEMNTGFEIPVRFGTNLRVTPNTDFEELFYALKRANFFFVNIGLESGSERIRHEVLKRYYSNDDIKKAVDTAHKYGLQVGLYNLIGLPGETRKDFRETIRLNRLCQPDWFLMSAFFPYPGTELYEVCREMGLLNKSEGRKLERRRPSMDLPGFTKRQIRRRYTLSPLLIYGGHKPLPGIIRMMVMSRILSNPRLLDALRALEWRFRISKQFEKTS